VLIGVRSEIVAVRDQGADGAAELRVAVETTREKEGRRYGLLFQDRANVLQPVGVLVSGEDQSEFRSIDRTPDDRTFLCDHVMCLGGRPRHQKEDCSAE
jgi:hypothetical protein